MTDPLSTPLLWWLVAIGFLLAALFMTLLLVRLASRDRSK